MEDSERCQPAPGREGLGDPRSILIVLPTWVGDFVMATPTLRAVRERFPGARITLLGENNLRDLIRGGSWMDEFLPLPPAGRRNGFHGAYRRLIGRLRRERFDLALLLPNSFRSALLARLSGAKRRVGFDRDGRGWLLTDKLAVPNKSGGAYRPRPMVEHYADLGEFIGCDRPDDRLELFRTEDCDLSVDARLNALGIIDRHPLVVMSPGAKYGAAKCWMPERFAAAADGLIESTGAAVVVTCGPGEEPIARAIGEAMGERGVVLVDRLLSLGELKSLIARADLLLCNDAGPRHFAKAFGVPVVTVFGPTDPQWTATSYAAERIVRIDVECGPCQKRECPLDGPDHLKCMKGVTVEAVVGAATELLGQRAARSVS